MRPATAHLPFLTLLAALLAGATTALPAAAEKRHIVVTAVEPKGGANVAKEPFPATPLPEGGGYQLGLESSHGNQYGRNMKSINNRFTGSGWGAAYVTANGVGYKWAVWQDNYLLDANAPDAKGKPAGTP